MMRPSACAVVMWLPSTKHSSWTIAGEAPLREAQGTALYRQAGAAPLAKPRYSYSVCLFLSPPRSPVLGRLTGQSGIHSARGARAAPRRPCAHQEARLSGQVGIITRTLPGSTMPVAHAHGALQAHLFHSAEDSPVDLAHLA